ncbi:unnamed protein product [Camellia sinensis]
MAPLLLLLHRKTFSLLLTITFLFLSCFPFSISSLSTVAISETGNLTVICASIRSASSSFLNCTNFPAPGTQTSLSPFTANNNNTSLSGIVAGNGFLCSLWSPPPPSSSTSVMGCWRFSNTNNTTQYKRIYHSRHASIKELDAGNSHICGLVNDNETTTNDRLSLECWQWKGFNSTGFNFSNIAIGEDFVCGLLEFGRIKCIQNQNNGNNNASVIGHEPDGNYSVIAAGFHHACAISLSNGSLECWGEMAGEKPLQGEFSSLALGENRSCAMQASNGTVICWGENNFSLPESLRNISFVAIEAKQRVFCGIVSSDYSLHCWGTEVFDSNSMVFQNVVPGPCTSKCRPCSSPLPDYGTFCGQGLQICKPCVVGGRSSSSPPLPLPPSPILPQPPPQEGTSGGWNKKMVAFLVVGCVGSVSLVMVCCFLFFRYCQVRGSRIHDSGPLDDEEGTAPSHPQSEAQSQTQIQTQTQALPVRVLEKRLSQTISMGNGGDHLEEFSLQELHQATNNFSDDHKIGTGSFGSVYHATLHDKRQVAIKRAETSLCPSHVGRSKRQEDKDTAFLNELEFLSRLNHKNLVRLLGYCEDNNELILVYEYMNNGTLHDHLHKHDTRTPLRSLSMSLNSTLISTWAARIKIALDAARGIEYLHMYAVPPIIHRDIKSSNILLDDTWTAKVSDFGLSLMGPPDDESHLSLHAAGTVGYIDPEYYKLQQLTAKSDVYSFGVVMLELLSGYNAIHRNENGVPRNVVDFMVPYIVQDEIHRVLDPNVPPPTPYEIEAVAHVGYLAVDCVKPQARYRPTMSYVVNRLEAALAACLATPPNLSLSRSSTRSST